MEAVAEAVVLEAVAGVLEAVAGVLEAVVAVVVLDSQQPSWQRKAQFRSSRDQKCPLMMTVIDYLDLQELSGAQQIF